MSGLVFALMYAALMVPTYILPYVGSNSAVLNGLSTGVGLGPTPAWWAHLWCLVLLVIVAWNRGGRAKKPYLSVLAIAAGLFDFVPVLSMIPLVPTVLHVLTIVFGVVGKKDEDENIDIAAQQRRSKFSVAATGIVSIVAAAGVASPLIFAKPEITTATVSAPSTKSDVNQTVPKGVAPTSDPVPAAAVAVPSEAETARVEQPTPVVVAPPVQKTNKAAPRRSQPRQARSLCPSACGREPARACGR